MARKRFNKTKKKLSSSGYNFFIKGSAIDEDDDHFCRLVPQTLVQGEQVIVTLSHYDIFLVQSFNLLCVKMPTPLLLLFLLATLPLTVLVLGDQQFLGTMALKKDGFPQVAIHKVDKDDRSPKTFEYLYLIDYSVASARVFSTHQNLEFEVTIEQDKKRLNFYVDKHFSDEELQFEFEEAEFNNIAPQSPAIGRIGFLNRSWGDAKLGSLFVRITRSNNRHHWLVTNYTGNVQMEIEFLAKGESAMTLVGSKPEISIEQAVVILAGIEVVQVDLRKVVEGSTFLEFKKGEPYWY